jgi:hypothetical protein
VRSLELGERRINRTDRRAVEHLLAALAAAESLAAGGEIASAGVRVR